MISVAVKAEHIRDGQRAQCRGCPVALALAEATGQRWAVFLDTGGWLARAEADDGIAPDLKLPLVVAIFMKRFDSGGEVYPFGFTIAFPAREQEERSVGLQCAPHRQGMIRGGKRPADLA